MCCEQNTGETIWRNCRKWHTVKDSYIITNSINYILPQLLLQWRNQNYEMCSTCSTHGFHIGYFFWKLIKAANFPWKKLLREIIFLSFLVSMWVNNMINIIVSVRSNFIFHHYLLVVWRFDWLGFWLYGITSLPSYRVEVWRLFHNSPNFGFCSVFYRLHYVALLVDQNMEAVCATLHWHDHTLSCFSVFVTCNIQLFYSLNL
jgi:hypothetical protein